VRSGNYLSPRLAAIKQDNTTKKTILGPIPYDISDAVRILLPILVIWVEEFRW
jgi:hypothetical protein